MMMFVKKLMMIRKDGSIRNNMFDNITKCNKEEYCSNKECQELYDDVKYTTLDDFKP